MILKIHFYILLVIFLFGSCLSPGDVHREEGKIFHASISGSGSVGGLYFGLYKDHKYQICSTGGIGQDCYNGEYRLNNDTLTLLNLDNQIHLKSNKLLISHYNQVNAEGNLGEVFQLDSNNNKITGKLETYFVIRLDSLSNYR
jgi:hypothetical protein